MADKLKANAVAAVAWAVENRIQTFILSCLGTHAAFVLWFASQQVWPCVALNVFSVCFYCYLAFVRRTFSETDMVLAYFEILLFAAMSTTMVGLDCGYGLFIFGMISILFMFAPNKGNLLYLFMFVGFVLLLLMQLLADSPLTSAFLPLRTAYAPHVTTTWIMNFCVVMALVMVSTFLFSRNSSENLARLDRLSYTDELTGLGNRRNFEACVNQMHEGYALAMLDIDDFKQVNDTYGHDVGDEVLKSVAAVMRANVRAGDELARWGGEEFVMCLPRCPIEPAARIAQSVRKDVAALTFHGLPNLHVTVTIGVTVSGAQDPADVVRTADKALYQGKRSGKNCVVRAMAS